jgi:hypothetical protein
MRALLIILFTSISLFCSAQSRREKKNNSQQPQQQPSSLTPNVPTEQTAPPKKISKKKKGDRGGATYSAEAKYYGRLEKLEKTRAREEKLKAKPQYSDPMYFGHKRPPKKNKRGKLKYCKECGIKH